MFLAIVGCRLCPLTRYNDFAREVDAYVAKQGTPSKIISGGAKGIDTLAALYASKRQIPLQVFEADWTSYGKSAGPIRNTAIVKAATHVLVFPSPASRGTYDTINKAKKATLVVTVSTLLLE